MRPDRRLSRRALALAATALLLAAASPIRAAGADPVNDEEARARQIAGQIDDLGRQDSALAERYDAAVLAQQQASQRVAVSQRSLDAASAQAAAADGRLRDLAVRSYAGGGVQISRGAGGGAPSDGILKASYLQVLAGRSTDALDGARAARLDLAHERSHLVSAKKTADSAVAAIASSKEQVTATEAKLQATLGQVKGHLADLVAAQQSATEAKAAAAAQARFVAAQRTPASLAAPKLTASPLGIGVVAARLANKPGAPAPAAPPAPSASGAAAAIGFARAQLGKPYVYGGAGPASFDCSGLTMRAWGAGGVSLPHNAAAQYGTVRHIPFGSLQPGDLVFESGLGHVGIYIGGGQMIHAPHSGDVVRVSSMWSSMNLAGRP
jgi:cell wall-associated NlpC family hydrolase